MASAPQVGPVCGPPTVECDLIGRFEQLLVVYHCDLIAWITYPLYDTDNCHLITWLFDHQCSSIHEKIWCKRYVLSHIETETNAMCSHLSEEET